MFQQFFPLLNKIDEERTTGNKIFLVIILLSDLRDVEVFFMQVYFLETAKPDSPVRR